MSAVTASLCSTLFVGVFVLVSADQKNITAESGQDVTLTCRAPNNNIRVVKWTRDDLEYKYVLLYQDGHFDPDHQHPSFKNRVDLQDRQMKDGDVSLILNKVTTADEGTYMCHVFMEGTRSWKVISIIYLCVDPPDQKTVPAVLGQDVTLTCRAPNKNNIRAVEWSRADLEDKYMLLFKDKRFVPDHQHPSFKNRVDLQDRQMKDGDVSVILKDVTINDAGTYKCHVTIEERQSLKLISIIYLSVDPGQTGGQEKDEDNKDGGKEDRRKEDGSVVLIVGLSVSAVLLAIVAAVYCYCNNKQCDLKTATSLESTQPLDPQKEDGDSQELKMS